MEIVTYRPDYRAALLDLSLAAWEPVFSHLVQEVPSFTCESFYPTGWRDRQYKDLADVLAAEPENVDVAVADGHPVGWVCTRLHPGDNMGEVYVLVVAPEYQRRGIGNMLMNHSFDRVRAAGMKMVMVETGGDSGHAPARAAYESIGFQRWPVARYFKEL